MREGVLPLQLSRGEVLHAHLIEEVFRHREVSVFDGDTERRDPARLFPSDLSGRLLLHVVAGGAELGDRDGPLRRVGGAKPYPLASPTALASVRHARSTNSSDNGTVDSLVISTDRRP